MTQFQDLTRGRFTCRQFSEQPVTREEVMQCLEAARLAPSAANSQPWKFYVALTPEMRMKLGGDLANMGINSFAEQAQAIVGVVEEDDLHCNEPIKTFLGHKFSMGDVGQAVAYFTLQAHELGIDTAIIGNFDGAYFSEIMGVPVNDHLRVVILMGRRAEDVTASEKDRRPVEDIVTFVGE